MASTVEDCGQVLGSIPAGNVSWIPSSEDPHLIKKERGQLSALRLAEREVG